MDPQIISQYKSMDKDGDGQVDLSELRQHLVAQGYEEANLDALVVLFDKNGDGEISIDEFAAGLAAIPADQSAAAAAKRQ
eukprot:gene10255-11957_t